MACKLAFEHPDAVDGSIVHNTKLPNVYQVKKNRFEYKKLKGLVINGKYDKILDPINSKQIANTFLRLGANIQSTELDVDPEFPKLSRENINKWIVQGN